MIFTNRPWLSWPSHFHRAWPSRSEKERTEGWHLGRGFIFVVEVDLYQLRRTLSYTKLFPHSASSLSPVTFISFRTLLRTSNPLTCMLAVEVDARALITMQSPRYCGLLPTSWNPRTHTLSLVLKPYQIHTILLISQNAFRNEINVTDPFSKKFQEL